MGSTQSRLNPIRLIAAFIAMATLMGVAINNAAGQSDKIPGMSIGGLSVDNNGSANYSIPIVVPPGTASMEPHLSLSYSSQMGNGLLGVGWSLSGISVIHRCARTIAQDNFKGGIFFDSGDRYCMDGQRLIALVDGTD